MTLLRISAPHFVAGVVLCDSDTQANRVAPILHYMRHWRLPEIRGYCTRKGWQLEIIDMT